MKHLFYGVLIAVCLFYAMSISYADVLPNSELTPGISRDLTLEQVCGTKWGKDKRAVPDAMKKEVFARYGYSGNDDQKCIPDSHGRHCEIDHLKSRELAGADDIENLWPQSYGGPCNATNKDRLENKLHKLVCNSSITLEEAQNALATNWIEAYSQYVDAKGCQ